ncbi:MAG TPA: nuclear transport factor 2 family protein [Baekduia sp.]|uniref:nuclear transport factor 2 family protein n=1 Tax=Baekduia sp. TaxID=2600305 RepID=UPI002D79E34B|nr:nuclear transport factor 2 family protein [Baekduia sp.]HET6506824.1 nuclear transport factor 2 family protein [Baekduia sp.]
MSNTPRSVFDRQLRLIAAGELEALVAQYHDDALLLRSDRPVVGHAALRDHFAALLATAPAIEVTQAVEAQDVLSYQTTVTAGEEDPVRQYGMLVLRGERIARHVTGVFPVASGGGRKTGAITVDLEPYTAWSPHAVPDPRSAGREAIGPVLLEIVSAEGPILAERAYRLYVKASGGKALTSIARAPLSGATFRLKGAGAIEMEEGSEVLRPVGTPEIRVRELGPRALDEVPLREVAELMRRLRAAGATELPRAVLDAYGLVRMTAKAEDFLAQAMLVADEE